MANLSTKIKLYCEENGVSNLDFIDDVKLQDDSNGQGAYIKEWNLGISQPTTEQIASYETAANTEEALQVVLNNRRAEYPDWGTQLDYIYHNGIDKWKTDIVDPVKTKYPKPS
tara:strand:+ start:247 stop:585 length:339 start_codon:yes stop_codon:yes gene_type:complete